ncbi:MAG TPA: hypothetical protein VLJ15_06320 [Gammaproteobacteria bacterium]|nr:hypothetical protein [Gammaproteobacteria bacterium]
MKNENEINQFALSLLLVIFSLMLFIALESLLLNQSQLAHFTKERYIYMSCLALLLPLCLGCIKLSFQVLPEPVKKIPVFMMVMTGWLVFWIVAIPAISAFWLLVLYGQPVLYAPFKHPLVMLSLFVAMVLIACLIALPGLLKKIKTESGKSWQLFWIILLVLLTGLVGSQHVSGLAAVQIEAPRWDANFEPVLYPLSQVLAGKTLLVDLPAQYGLYAELIAPFFKMIGFSISKITFFFALLEGMSYLALAFVFLKLTKSTVFRLFWLLSSAVLFGFSFQNYPSHPYFDPYYQYYPIRLFFPAVAVFLFWRWMLINPTIRNIFVFSVFLATGVIWNLDSGVPALGAFLAYLIISAFFANKTERRASLKILGLAVFGMTVTFLLFAIYMTLKSGVSVPWSEWLHYQRVFYIFGYGAIPTPLAPHPWMAVIVLYLIGILGYMRFALQRETPDDFWKLMLYLGVMGLGLFAYYQNRSHDAVFLAAFWPALFMGYAYSERFLQFHLTSCFSRLQRLTLLPCFILGSAFCGFFIYKLPTMASQARYNWTMAFRHAHTPVTENIAFMQARISAKDRQSIELVTWFQALYFAELNIPSAIKGPGTGGAMPGEDQAFLIRRIEAAKPGIIFLQQGFMPLVEEALKKDYHPVDKNTNNLLELRRNSSF